MNIPKKIKLGANTWTIQLAMEQHQEDRRGCTYKDLRKIQINPSLSADLQWITFVHELLHACADFVGIEDEKLTEEDFIKRISPILATALKENNFLDLNSDGGAERFFLIG